MYNNSVHAHTLSKHANLIFPHKLTLCTSEKLLLFLITDIHTQFMYIHTVQCKYTNIIVVCNFIIVNAMIICM